MEGPQSITPPKIIRQKIGEIDWSIHSDAWNETLAAHLRAPAEFMAPPAESLRPDDSRRLTELVRTRWSDLSPDPIIIKRYIRKNIGFLLKYLFRTSRARHCFAMSFRLEALQIATAKAIAAGERRSFLWLVDSYFLSWEVPSAVTLGEFRKTASAHQMRQVFRQIGRMLAILHDQRMVHSDLSLTNFLVQTGNPARPKVVAVDLDAIRRYPLYQVVSPVGFVLKQIRLLMRRVPLSPRERMWVVAQYCRVRQFRPFDPRTLLERLS